MLEDSGILGSCYFAWLDSALVYLGSCFLVPNACLMHMGSLACMCYIVPLLLLIIVYLFVLSSTPLAVVRSYHCLRYILYIKWSGHIIAQSSISGVFYLCCELCVSELPFTELHVASYNVFCFCYVEASSRRRYQAPTSPLMFISMKKKNLDGRNLSRALHCRLSLTMSGVKLHIPRYTTPAITVPRMFAKIPWPR